MKNLKGLTDSNGQQLEARNLKVEISTELTRPEFNWIFYGFKFSFPMTSKDDFIKQVDAGMSIKEAMNYHRSKLSCEKSQTVEIFPLYGTLQNEVIYSLNMESLPLEDGKFIGFAYYVVDDKLSDRAKAWGTTIPSKITLMARSQIEQDLKLLSLWKNKKLIKIEIMNENEKCIHTINSVERDDTSINNAIKEYFDISMEC